MFKKIAVCSFTAALFAASSVAIAHTGVKDKGVGGTTLYTALTIGHGCGSTDNETTLPVIAQKVVFPNNGDSEWKKIGTDGTETATTIDQVVEGVVFGLAPGLIQDRSIFNKMREVVDSNTLVGAHPAPNVRGFEMWEGRLGTDLTGLVPFRVSPPKFVGCARSLKVRLAIANWCRGAAQNAYYTADKKRRADFWLGKATTKFNDPAVASVPVAATSTTPAVAGYWPTLTITRDLTTNPYTQDCAGQEFDAAVEPSAADIDTNLPMRNFPDGALSVQ
jgi:hypothetical protein